MVVSYYRFTALSLPDAQPKRLGCALGILGAETRNPPLQATQ